MNGVYATAWWQRIEYLDGGTISFQIPDGADGWAALNNVTLTKVISEWVPLTRAQGLALGDFRIMSASAEAANRTFKIATRSA